MNHLSKFKLCGGLCGEKRITVTSKLLYLFLSELADANGEIIISQRSISAVLNISIVTVSRNLRWLRNAGHIRMYSRYHSDGGRATNKYVVK